MKVPDVIEATFALGYRKGFADAIHDPNCGAKMRKEDEGK